MREWELNRENMVLNVQTVNNHPHIIVVIHQTAKKDYMLTQNY